MKKLLLAVAAAASIAAPAAFAAGGKVEPYQSVDWPFNGPFGAYDKEAVQRGFQVYRQVCASCHSVKLLAFRNFGDKGGPYDLPVCKEEEKDVSCPSPNENPIVRALAAEYQITDGPDDSGDLFQRPGVPSDRLPVPYPNEPMARLANGGALPPDLSLMIKARKDGADYVYSLLTGYEAPPATVNVAPTQHYNKYFGGDMSQLLKPEFLDEEGHPKEGVEIPHGGVLAMTAPLKPEMVDYEDEATPETVDQYAYDVVNFLAWASEPKMEQRKRLGFMTIAYLLILCGILYWSYRTLWSKVDH
jgi:ubiquinol-cytochrome c reductase cytochrome c1 subunit